MGFGKRTGSEPRSGRPDAQFDENPASGEPAVSAPGIGVMRTRVANHGDIDKNFVFLAIGVVVLAAGAAVAAPALISVITGANVRPIEQVIAGLDRQGARAALASEAFPDADGRAFMTSLATNFPREHDRLLNTLTDSAMAGGDRDDLYLAMNGWSMTFAPTAMASLSRTGAQGFDAGVTMLGDALKFVESEAGGCTLTRMQHLIADPAALERFTKYDGPAYHFGMRASRSFVDLAASGRNAQPIDTRLTANDMSALQSTFFSLMGDSQVMSLVQAASSQGGGYNMQADLADKINFCQLGRTILIKMKGLPDGTKARLFGTIMTQDLRSIADGRSFSGATGGLPLGMLSGR
jgi:hypothetical protein